MRDRRRTPMLPPGLERPDVLETLRGFLLRPLDALLRVGSSQMGGPSPPDEGLATDTPAGLMELWRRGTSVWTPSPPSAQLDSVTAVGQWTELVAQVPPMQRPRTAHVRFLLAGREVGTAPYLEGALSYLPFQPDVAGLFALTFEPLDRRGRPLGLSDDGQWLQVVSPRPVVAVDVDLLFSGVPGVAESLRAVAGEDGLGWQLVYLDRSPQPRRALARARIEEWRLPRAAMLVQQAETGLGKLEPVHEPALLEAELRRLRADGVPLSVFVSHADLVPACLAREVTPVVVPQPPPRLADQPVPSWPPRRAGSLGFDVATRKHVEASAKRHQRALAAHSGVRFRLDQMTPSVAVAGHSLRLELDNRAAREAVFAAIDASEQSVQLQCYIFEPSRFAEDLAVRLIRCARRGVRVSLLVDALYSRQEVLGAVNPLLEGLAHEPGVDVRASKPIPTFGSMDVRTVKERDHRKLIVVDSTLAFVSGRNVGDAYYSGFDEVPIADFTVHERIPWLDAHLELRGPVVSDIESAFQAAFDGAGEHLEAGTRIDAASPPAVRSHKKVPSTLKAGRDTCRLVLHDGVHDAYGLTAYEALIDVAQREVYVVNAFPVFNRLRDTIARAVRRGVAVHLLTGCALTRRSDGSFFAGGLHRELFEYMLKQRLEELVRANVRVYEYVTLPTPNIVSLGGVVRPYVHAKMLAVDGLALSVGSANLDATASFWEREANIIIEGGKVPAEAQRLLAELCARSHPLDLDSKGWRAESAQRELVSRLWPTSLYS
ncbi:MAG: phosphatidylserine/phosphatidylglycerophosphate/cardiolipin synthase family protein [Sandaracinaceae bacterium]|nr:phosphatidylserine/phosphatidylglycerophosphate/cardiolipin synthase family protein [Sandaracinaceae bacterium]